MRDTRSACSRAPLAVAAALLLAQAAAAESEVLRVGVAASPPFAIAQPDGRWSGVAVALWKAMADELDVGYELRPYATADRLLDAVAAGEVDLAIGRLDVTGEREARVDFTHPFHRGGLGVATRWRGRPGWREDVRSLLDERVLRILGVGSALLLLTGLLVWAVERRRNPQHFGPRASGVSDGIWWSAVTMTTVGYGDKAPVTGPGRVIALAWMFASLVIIASFTGAIASALTVSHLQQQLVRTPADLARIRTAAVEASVAAGWLEERGIGYEPAADVRAALDLLVAGRVEGVVHDAAVLRYLLSEEYAGVAELAPPTVEPEDYAFALPPGSPRRERISRALIDQLRERGWTELRRAYLEP